MIAFGAADHEPEPYRRYAEPGIAARPRPTRWSTRSPRVGSIFRSYNLAARHGRRARGPRGARARPPARRDRRSALLRKVREALRDPDVGVVGCVGAVDVRSIAWWEGAVTCGLVTHRYHEHGGGELPAFHGPERTRRTPAPARSTRSTASCSCCRRGWCATSASTSRSASHGYDLDFCLQVRDAGRKVVTADLDGRPPPLARADRATSTCGSRPTSGWPRSGTERLPRRRRADGRLEGAGPQGGRSARPPRAIAYSNGLQADARVRELERELEEQIESSSAGG